MLFRPTQLRKYNKTNQLCSCDPPRNRTPLMLTSEDSTTPNSRGLQWQRVNGSRGRGFASCAPHSCQQPVLAL